ncbi:MAG: hypothetical protein O7C75_00475 [Verrucomicrobia bacterium]|nr:hypothetical protein [Verrucomicrobiota bacterium]
MLWNNSALGNCLSKYPIISGCFAMCCLLFVDSSALHAQSEHPGDPLHHDPHFEHESNVFVHALWDSKYESKGRDNLDEGGLGSFAVEWTTESGNNEFVLGAWYAEGISADYSELNVAAAYILPNDSVDITLGYTWLDFAEDDKSDNELSVEFGRSVLDSLNLIAAFVYSTEASGTFIELIASTEIIRNEFTLTPYALLGINEGFVSGKHKGFNNLQFGIEAATPISDSLELSGYVAFTIGLREEPGESPNDIFWVGLGLGFGN